MRRIRKIKFARFLMLFSLAVVLLLLALFGSILYTKTTRFITEKKDFIHSTRMNQIAYDIGKAFDGLYHIVDNLKQNERLVRYVEDLRNDKLDQYQKYVLSKEIESFLYNIKKENGFVQHILVVTDNDQFSSDYKYIDYGLIGPDKWIKRSDDVSLVPPGKTGDYFAAGSATDGGGAGAAANMLNRSTYLASELLGRDGNPYGMLFVVLDPAGFTETVAGHEHFALLNSDRTYMFKGGKFNEPRLDRLVESALESKQADNIRSNEFEIRVKDVPFYRLKLLYLEENSFHDKQRRLIGILVVGTFLLCVGIAFVASRLIAGNLLSPVRKLIKLLELYDPERNRLNRYREQDGPRKLMLRDRFFLYFLVTILLPLTSFIVIFYWQSSSIMANEVKTSYETVYEKNANEIEHFLSQKEIIMARLAFDSIVQERLLASPSDGPSTIGEIHRLVDDYRYLGSDKDTIRIFDRSGRQLYSNRLGPAVPPEPDFFGKLRASGAYFGYLAETDEFGNHSVTLGIPVKHPVGLSETIGYVTIRIEGIYLQNLYANGKDRENETFLVDWNRQIVSHPNKDEVLQTFDIAVNELSAGEYRIVDGKKMYVYAKRLKHLPWVYVSVYDYSSFRAEGMRLIYSDLYLIVIVLLLVVLFSYWMARRLLKPLGRLNLLFHQFELEDVEHRYAPDDPMIDEIDQLSRTFNAMIERIDDLVDETMIANREKLRLEFEKKETQITALQAQINPHFLYNTLDTLIFMLEKNERDKAIGMVTSLSRLFRYITQREQLIVPLQDEIAYAKSYVELMKVRYDHIDVSWAIEPNALESRTLKFILQPIIENAVRHGAREYEGKVRIVISARAEGERIVLAVFDDGEGIGEEELESIRRQLAGQSERKIGIFNVDSRLKLHYGEEYGLRIESEYGAWTQVTITIPG